MVCWSPLILVQNRLIVIFSVNWLRAKQSRAVTTSELVSCLVASGMCGGGNGVGRAGCYIFINTPLLMARTSVITATSHSYVLRFSLLSIHTSCTSGASLTVLIREANWKQVCSFMAKWHLWWPVAPQGSLIPPQQSAGKIQGTSLRFSGACFLGRMNCPKS